MLSKFSLSNHCDDKLFSKASPTCLQCLQTETAIDGLENSWRHVGEQLETLETFCRDTLETLLFSRLFSKFVSKFSRDGDMLETRWRHAGDMMETCWRMSPTYVGGTWRHCIYGDILETCWRPVGDMLETVSNACWRTWGHCIHGDILGTCWRSVGDMLETCWRHVGDILQTCCLETCWRHVGDMLETLCLEIDMLETCWRLLQCIRIPDPAVIMQTCKAQYTCGTRNNIKTHMTCSPMRLQEWLLVHGTTVQQKCNY